MKKITGLAVSQGFWSLLSSSLLVFTVIGWFLNAAQISAGQHQTEAENTVGETKWELR